MTSLLWARKGIAFLVNVISTSTKPPQCNSQPTINRYRQAPVCTFFLFLTEVLLEYSGMLNCCEKVNIAYYTVAKIKTIIILNRNGIGVRELKQNFYNHNGQFLHLKLSI